MSINTWQRGAFEISTDPERIDRDTVHAFLATDSYWAAGIPREVFDRAVDGSLPFGVYRISDGRQLGFARVVSDRATFAWIGDVCVLDEFRGQGLGKWLMETIVAHSELQGLRRWMLATRDAHGLYRRYGFTELHDPARFMERWDRDVYKPGKPSG